MVFDDEMDLFAYSFVENENGDGELFVLETDEESQIELLLSTLKKLIDATNIITPDLNLSISYGYATCNEVIDRNIEKVYQLADKRMYDISTKSVLPLVLR